MNANARWHRNRDLKKNIGRSIARQLPSIRQKTTVAKMMGMTRENLDSLESLALFKVAALLLHRCGALLVMASLLGCVAIVPKRDLMMNNLVAPRRETGSNTTTMLSFPTRTGGPVFRGVPINIFGTNGEVLIPWKYDVSNTNAYYWDLQETSNLVSWVTTQTNLGPEDVMIKRTNQHRFYRLKGRQ